MSVMNPTRTTLRWSTIIACAAFLLLISHSCNNSSQEQENSTHVNVVLDSTWYVMNPMDIEFDSMELSMIDSGLAELITDYRLIRAYQLPNSTPPALQFNPIPLWFQDSRSHPKNIMGDSNRCKQALPGSRPGLHVHTPTGFTVTVRRNLLPGTHPTIPEPSEKV